MTKAKAVAWNITSKEEINPQPPLLSSNEEPPIGSEDYDRFDASQENQRSFSSVGGQVGRQARPRTSRPSTAATQASSSRKGLSSAASSIASSASSSTKPFHFKTATRAALRSARRLSASSSVSDTVSTVSLPLSTRVGGSRGRFAPLSAAARRGTPFRKNNSHSNSSTRSRASSKSRFFKNESPFTKLIKIGYPISVSCTEIKAQF